MEARMWPHPGTDKQWASDQKNNEGGREARRGDETERKVGLTEPGMSLRTLEKPRQSY